jgi:hypothetical protein
LKTQDNLDVKFNITDRDEDNGLLTFKLLFANISQISNGTDLDEITITATQDFVIESLP